MVTYKQILDGYTVPWRCRVGMAALLSIALAKPVFPVSFNTPRSYVTGQDSVAVATADLNGDGKLDLAVVNFGSGSGGSVNILLGVGHGEFREAGTYRTIGGASGVYVADFNRDGAPDLAVTNGNQVSIFLGNGNGTFRPAGNYAVGLASAGITGGDFNADGNQDLAVTNSYVGTVSVLLGNGDGTFQNAVAYTVGNNALAIVRADFNGDGKLDLAVANYNSNTISLLLGNGNGTFQPSVTYNVATAPDSLAVGDFNRDGTPDLAVSFAGGNVNFVSILLGTKHGGFLPPVNYTVPLGGGFVTAADFHGDGRLDLAVLTGGSDVSILTGVGNGTFLPAATFAVSTYLTSIAVGDFNRDGKLDMAITGGAVLSGSLTIVDGDGHGGFQHPLYVTTASKPNPLTSVVSADFNGDGKADLAVTSADNSVGVLLGNGDGTFQSPDNYTVGANPTVLAVGDFNNDGVPDLAVPDTIAGTIYILFGNGDGTFRLSSHTYGGGSQPTYLAAGDLNGDGNQDLAIVANGGVVILLGDGKGGFASPVTYQLGPGPTTPVPVALAIADLNEDGKLDIAVACLQAGAYVLLGKGDGTFGTAVNYPAGSNPQSVAIGDFNGDRIPDLAVADYYGIRGLQPAAVSILLGNGDGSFQPPRAYPVGYFALGVAVADFNNDGNLDVVVVGQTGISVLAGDGHGNFKPAENFAIAGLGWFSLAVADINGDGLPDLMVPGAGSGEWLTVLTNTPAH